MKRLRGIWRFALLVALAESVFLLIAWAGKAYTPALHVDCVPRVIGGIQYVCKQPSVDVPATYDVGWLLTSVPSIVLEIAIVVGASLLIAAAVHLTLGRVFRQRPAAGSGPQVDLDRAAVHPRREGMRGPRPGYLVVARPKPLFIAVGVAVVWAILSVGPTQLASDLGWLIPRDTVTAPSCSFGSTPSGPYCSSPGNKAVGQTGIIGPNPPVLSDPDCPEGLLDRVPPESDGMCHERSGGDVTPLEDDVFAGAESGLLAFLAIGAALLLWPRLRAASQLPS